MFHKLHLQLTFFCTLVTGCIFLIMTVVCLSFAEGSIGSSEYSSFLMQINSVLIHLQEQDTISHQWLNQLQEKGRIRLFLYDNNEPLYYQNYHNSEREDALTEEVIDTAAKEYQMDIFHTTVRQVITHKEFDFTSSMGDDYYVSAGIIPRKENHMSFLLLFSLEKQQDQIRTLRLIVCLAEITAIVLLFIFSWFFTAKMIVPLKNNRERQMHFIASASHELRAPLSVLRTGLEALKKAESNAKSMAENEADSNTKSKLSSKASSLEKREHFISYMEEETVRMQNLVNDMLLLANADSAHLSICKEQCQPEELLIDVFEKFESVAAKKGIALSISLSEEMLPDCHCDRERMIQVFSILLDNALSYTPVGGKVRLILSREKNTLHFGFSDSGCGIPDEEKERIFDRFYRSDRARADKSHFGLGLCIAKEIVEGHQGRIWVEDSAEGGSCFWVEMGI